MNKLSGYCAKGSKAKEEMIPVSKNVSLKVITFTPSSRKKNPKVVFVAGWASLITGWQKVLKEMTKDFTVYYVETREKKTSKIEGNIDFSIDAIGQDLVEIISHFKLKDNDYIFFGSSLGATTILNCSPYLPKKPICLVLVGPNAYFRIPRFGKALVKIFYPPMYLWVKPYLKWYLKNFRLDVKSDPAQFEKYCGALDAADPWKLKKAAKAFFDYKVWDVLDKIEYPALIIGASKDELHEPENLKKITAKMKYATYLDMGTNENSHSKEAVVKMREYLKELKVKAQRQSHKK